MADPIPSPIPDEHTVVPALTTWQLLESMDFMAIELQMLLSAILIIYVGAHASLRRPPSAAPPVKSKGKGKEDEDKEKFTQGFEAWDAVLFPLMAGTVLIGLYYLIKWLQDPTVLNKIIRWYMSLTGVVSTGCFIGNTLYTLLSFVFPEAWVDREGRLFKIHSRTRTQRLIKATKEAQVSDGGVDSHDGNSFVAESRKRTPFAGSLASELPVPARIRSLLFQMRHLLLEDWTVEFALFGSRRDSASFNVTTLLGFVAGLAIQGAYLYTSNNHLANVIGLAVCYTACQYMSVTSFSIGSLVLGGLFFYDIIMVFYTPFMIGVATQLDVPIKLTYMTTKRSSILGLGDIVIPGIFICLALRFDLWKHYQQKITQEETHSAEAATANSTSDSLVKTVKTAHREIKAPFVDPRGQWGTAFWTTSWRDLLRIFGSKPLTSSSLLPSVAESAFPKTYFHATILGYLVGMLTTVSVLLVFQRGQPALLYLVPGVVGSAYVTGWLRGEVKQMWTYTEDGSLDVKDVVVDVDANGNIIPKPKEARQDQGREKEHSAEDKLEETAQEAGTNAKAETKENKGDSEEVDKPFEVLHFSISVPREATLKEE
ncbi:signal peptide peptidase-domain-containing protein [Coniella lustricola]|uniref:Signal peptide peptidase-domain-containing protein n=1 Tax=Coniella lustricola TaxID=2025994 RepID=A0A2T3AA57_9PEZI|nr:signal peptide peptidase-domain-containing protein [Coniella lustricola]